MTDEQRVAAGGLPRASWVFIGVFIAAVWGTLGYTGQDSVIAGVLVAGIASLLVLAAFALWQRAQSQHPVPSAEYLAVVWLLSFLVLGTVDAVADGQVPSWEWLILVPPMSFIPPLLRRLLGDDGEPRGSARSAAYYAHQVLGALFCGLGVLFVISVLLIIAAPVPLVLGIMHLRAGSLYRQQRNPKQETDPRRGFLDEGR